ncbi:hypothetical protein F2Q70_00017286 [Brassica cretica]|uniref:Uncharacterized protein n=1 Tax=Brassica cretica TaxID=69181 RepID=A0A8S9I2F3_BRACR|nr:hypothetical protein F2Q70_00017286 [Brassica cretica]
MGVRNDMAAVKQKYFSVPGFGEYGLTWSHIAGVHKDEVILLFASRRGVVLAALCPRLGEPLSAFHDVI